MKIMNYLADHPIEISTFLSPTCLYEQAGRSLFFKHNIKSGPDINSLIRFTQILLTGTC